MRLLLAVLTAALTLAAEDQIAASVRGGDGALYLTGRTDDRPFARKLNGRGEVLYSAILAAPAGFPRSIAVNAKGEALIGGLTAEGPTGFILKLDAAGSKTLVVIRGYGLGPVAYDAADNIYTAGAAYGVSEIQAAPDAFQTAHELRGCGGNAFIGIACFYQYVAKLSPDGAKVLYATFLTGSFGAQPSGLLVDDAGNAIVAGSTNSPDYPVTEGSYQPEYRAAIPPPPPALFRPTYYPPPSSGYLTKLNATGTALVWSTYFSGSGAESIGRLQLTDKGSLAIAGLSSSRDLPESQGLPRGCPVGYFPDIPFVAELSGDGKTLTASRYVYDIDNPGTVALPYLCLVDSADIARLTQVAPGQLVTVFGDFAEGTTVSIGGLPAPMLYSSAEQLNIQVPLEAEGQALQLVAGANARPVSIVTRAPSVFMDLTKPLTPVATCAGSSFSPAYPAIARNEDGSLNTCEHPAAKGSVLTFYLNGLGRTAPSATLDVPFGQILSLEPDPDSPGVWRMQFQLPSNVNSGSIMPLIDGARLRYPLSDCLG